MTLLAEMPDVEVAGDEDFFSWLPQRHDKLRVALASPLPVSFEDIDIDFKLAAVVDETVVATVDLGFRRRVRIDAVAHLYTETLSALAAHLTLDPKAGSLQLSLTFEASGRDAGEALRTAEVLHEAGRGGLALVMPDGTLSADRIDVPAELEVDQSFIAFLQLFSDISELAGMSITVPENPDPAVVRELLNARRLLRGEAVRGRWKDGQVAFDPVSVGSLHEVIEVGARHQFAVDADLAVTLEGVQIPLGLIRRQFDDAVVESIEQEGGQVVMRLRAHDGSADMVMSPVPAGETGAELQTRFELQPEAFDALVAAIEEPARFSRLQTLV